MERVLITNNKEKKNSNFYQLVKYKYSFSCVILKGKKVWGIYSDYKGSSSWTGGCAGWPWLRATRNSHGV